MTYQPPTRKIHPLRLAEREAGVKWPKALSAALAATDVAAERKRRANAMANVARRELEAEWLEAKAAWDIDQANTVEPQDFEPFPEARPNLDHLQDIVSAYVKADNRASRAVDALAADYDLVLDKLDRAWGKLPAVDLESTTVAQAAAIEAERKVKAQALRNTNLYAARAAGCTELERKAMQRAAKADPGTLPNLDAIRAEMTGTDVAEVKRGKMAKARAKALAVAGAAEAAKARNPKAAK